MSTRSGLLSYPALVLPQKTTPPLSATNQRALKFKYLVIIIIVVVPRPPSFHIHPLLDKF
jgi:hypothetical protein